MKKIKVCKITALILSLMLLISAMPLGFMNVSAAGSKTYYVAADGKSYNSGLTENSPISLEAINNKKLYGGDTVLFKRGDTFYGRFVPNLSSATDENRLNVNAYGEGDLPTISLVKIVNDAWVDNGDGFYKCDLSVASNYTGVSNSFLDKENYANVGFLEAENGNIFGERFSNAESCINQFSFYCDYNNIYVKSDVNPYEALGEIKMPIHNSAVIRHKGFINIENIHIKYGGYGISASFINAESVTIQNCIIEYLGGQDIDSGEGFTRGGNGIELYNKGINITVTNNIFRQIFDVAFTCQGYGWDAEEIENEDGTVTKITEAIWDNITVTNNIFSYCSQAFEIWSSATTENSGITNLEFSNNLCIGQGEGWTNYFRAANGKSHALTDILTYGYHSPKLEMTITGNTYFHSKDEPVFFSINNYTDSKFLDTNYVVSDNNHYYHLNATSIAYLKLISGISNFADMKDFSGWQSLGQDANSTFTAIGNNLDKYSAMTNVALTSYNFNDIADAVKDAGLAFNLTYDETATSAAAIENNITVNATEGGTASADAVIKGDYCTVTVTTAANNGKVLKADGLKYTLNGKTYPIVKRVDAANADGSFNVNSESQCTVFMFDVKNNATNIVIDASFVDIGDENIAVIGTSVNKSLVSMRFRSRAYRKLVIGGQNYTLKSTGTLLFKEEQSNLDEAWEDLAYGNIEGKNIKTTQLYDRTNDYYEYVCHINYDSSNSSYLDDTYYAYAYAVYQNLDGKTVRIYSSDVAHSYNDVLNFAK